MSDQRCPLSLLADGQGSKRDLRQKTVSSGTIQGYLLPTKSFIGIGKCAIICFQ